MGYCPWGHKESDMAEQLHFLFLSKCMQLLRGMAGCGNKSFLISNSVLFFYITMMLFVIK